MARRVQELGVRPELEVFDTGHLVMVKQLIADGLIDPPPLIQLCTGDPLRRPRRPRHAARDAKSAAGRRGFSAFSIGRIPLPFVALAAIVGGNVRGGLEDNLMLARGTPATDGQLVERAVQILQAMNVRILDAAEVRTKLGLTRSG